jgi:hypothetical protein
MIVHDCEQGSQEWVKLRLGIPTASAGDKLLTPKSKKPSEARHAYRYRLLTEWLLGCPIEDGDNAWMARGLELEQEARDWYAFDRDVEVRKVGFITRDDGLFGGSPDGLVGDDGITEIKVLSAVNHVRAMLSDANEHFAQCQGLMEVSGRQWTDLIFYNPVLPPVVRRKALEPVLNQFIAELEIDKSRLWQHKVGGSAVEYSPFTDAELAQFEHDTTAAVLSDRLTKQDAINARAYVVVGRWREARRLWERCR